VVNEKTRYLSQDAADVALKNPIAQHTIRKAREYRLERTRKVLRDNDIAAALLYDPCNIRYATDTSNMQLWTMHNPSRYALIFADGPALLFDYRNCSHLHHEVRLPNGQLTVDEIRPAIAWAYFAAGERGPEQAVRWGNDIASLMKQYGGGNKRLAVDICEELGMAQLHKHGIETLYGMKYMEHARLIKSAEELQLMQWTITVCQKGMDA
jgi:Xaa-Pro dipeptidase